MSLLTEKQNQIIEKNLNAFAHNFGEPRIERTKYGSFFLVYYPSDDTNFTFSCNNINELNGWLYGCVQGALVVSVRARRISE